MKTTLVSTVILAFSISGLSYITQAQWVQMNLPVADVYAKTFASKGEFLFVGTSVGVFRTSDDGASWAPVDSGMQPYTEVFSLAIVGGDLFAATVNRTVYRSTNDGVSWTDVGEAMGGIGFLTNLAAGGTNLFVGGGGIFRSTDRGITWTSISSGFPAGATALGFSDPYLFAGTWGYGVFRSTNYGSSWSQITFGPPDVSVDCIATMGTRVFIGTRGSSLFYSSDDGASWDLRYSGLTDVLPERPEIMSLAFGGDDIFAGIPYGVFVSTNGGQSWSMWNTGLEEIYQNSSFIQALAAHHGYLFAGAGNRSVWRRPLSEVATGVGVSRGLPTAFSLEQNFPNPFNPSTTIKFELPKAAYVSLTVYDILGREVSVLVNERREAGVHEVRFDGSNLASGVYFYRLQAGDYFASKKMLVLK